MANEKCTHLPQGATFSCVICSAPTDPKTLTERLLEERAKAQASECDCGCHYDPADDGPLCDCFKRTHFVIDHLVSLAVLVGRIQQAEWDRGLISGCACAECGDTGYNALRKERDRLLAELEKHGL